MKRKLLSIIAASILAVALIPGVAFAAGETCDGGSECSHEAAIGTAHYATVLAAVNDANSGDSIKLLKDVSMPKAYFGAKAGQSLTLDLNGKTLTRTWQEWGGDNETTQCVIYNQGTLTIKDSSSSKSGKIQGYSDTSGNAGWNQDFRGAAISNASGATLNIEGGTITRGDVNSFGYYTVINKGTINMSGGLIVNDSCSSAMVRNMPGGSVFNMTGGKLSQKRFQTLKSENGSTINICGGTLESDDRTLQCYGTATISGGTLNGDIQIPASGNLSITNGTLNGEMYGKDGKEGTVSVSGGSFSQPVPDRFCAADYVPTQNADGSYSVVVPVEYSITVNSGTATVNGAEGSVALEGDAIVITADSAPEGKVFDKWEITGLDTSNLDLSKETINFDMPASDVVATATYVAAAEAATSTGDHTNLMLPIVMAILALGAIATLMVSRKQD